MDIDRTVTVTYPKRGNYEVDSNCYDGGGNVNRVTRSSCSTSYARTERYEQRSNGAACNHNNDNNKQERSSVRKEDCVQGESLPTGCKEQTFVSTWSLATPMGKTSLEYIQTSQRGGQVCSTQIRIVVQGFAPSPGKELVLTNESA